jgi:hypothetical protein
MCYRSACFRDNISQIGSPCESQIDNCQAEQSELVNFEKDPTFCFDCLAVDSGCNHSRRCKINDATSRITAMMKETLNMMQQQAKKKLEEIELLEKAYDFSKEKK